MVLTEEQKKRIIEGAYKKGKEIGDRVKTLDLDKLQLPIRLQVGDIQVDITPLGELLTKTVKKWEPDMKNENVPSGTPDDFENLNPFGKKN
jgi:hypothetical protein